MTLPTKAALVAFIATRERAAAKAFYQDVLGLRLVADDPFALVFDSHGVTVRITEIRGHAPSAHTVLGWTVPDMASAVSGLVAKGPPLSGKLSAPSVLVIIFRGRVRTTRTWRILPSGRRL